MINIIEYLLLFLLLAVFSFSNVFNYIYLALSMITLVGYIIVYLYKKKKYKLENTKYHYDLCFYIFLLSIIGVNLINRLEYVNFLFGIIFLVSFMINLIKCIFKKEDILNKMEIKSTYLFEVYNLIYLAGLVVTITSYQI